jgi:major membrane immunogen (membrane-anchored lipoprotein)
MKQLKLALVFVLTAVMLLGCGTVAFAEGAAGTAQAPGLDETVTVTITVEDGVITAAEASTDKAEETVGRQALTDLPAAMVENNSVAVDGISGATATSNAVLTAAAQAYLQAIGVDIDLDAWAAAAGYGKGGAPVDVVTSATESGVGGINFGDVELPDDMKKELILEYLKGAEGNYREMYQIATSVNNIPTIGSVEYVLDPADLTLFGSSETNTAKLNNMNLNPNVDLYWTRQIRAGDVCSEALPVLPSYFMSYGVQITGTYKAIRFAELSEEEIPVYVAKAHYYFETLDTTAQLAAMDDEALYAYLCQSTMNFYQIIPSRIVVTSPWFLNVYDTGYARQFVDEEMQARLLEIVRGDYPEAEALTTLDFATFSATGLKTQQVLRFS